MLRKAASAVAWVGRTASMIFGLALVLALIFGAASVALAGTGVGARFDLGKINKVNAVSSLVGSVSGPTLILQNERSDRAATALSLEMGNTNLAPMRTNATGTVANLSADSLDGLDSTEVGINGYKFVRAEKFGGSPTKQVAVASCPAGTKILGGGGHVLNINNDPNRDSAPLVMKQNGVDLNGFDSYSVVATEIEPYEFDWGVFAVAVCAKVGNP